MYFVHVCIVAHFALLGATLGSLLGPFGAPRAPKGLSLASLWFPLAPLVLRGAIWGTFGSPGELGMTLVPKGTSISEQMDLKYATCAQKETSRNSAPRAAYPHKVAQEPQLPTPLHSRRGLG